jgi:uncharacterized OB-fold protein
MATRSEDALRVVDFPGGGELAPLLPPVTAQNAPYFDALRRGRLVLQRCAGCERVRAPIGPVCPFCSGEAAAWATLSGRGAVHSWIRYRRSYLPEFESLLPYVVLCVALEEGARLFGRLVDDDAGKDPYPGMPVETVVERWPDGGVVQAFARARSDEA